MRLRDPRFLHDEGMVTWIHARFFAHEPAATFFLQKAKAVGAVFYAPVAAAGLVPFLIAHVVVAALAVPMIAAVARALGMRYPNIAALVLSTSPLFLVSGPLGFSNADANVAFLAALYLLVVKRREVLAGVLLGMLPWIRSEAALLAIIIVLHQAVFARRLWVAAGAAAFPLAYFLVGALYHRHALWMLRWPPAAPVLQGIQIFEALRRDFHVGVLVSNWLELTPVIGVALLPIGARPRHGIERAFSVFLWTYLIAISAAPFYAIGNFNLSPRYAMQALPLLALVVARRVEPNDARSAAPRVTELIALAGLWALAHVIHTRDLGIGRLGVLALLFVAIYAAIAALQAAQRPLFAACAAALICASGPIVLQPQMRSDGYAAAVELDDMASMLQRHRHRAGVVYTNVSLLPRYLERTGQLPGARVEYLLGADQEHELTSLSNEANGQRDRLMAAARRTFFGPLADRSLERAAPPQAMFLLLNEHRTKLLLRGAIAEARHVELGRASSFRLTELKAP